MEDKASTASEARSNPGGTVERIAYRAGRRKYRRIQEMDHADPGSCCSTVEPQYPHERKVASRQWYRRWKRLHDPGAVTATVRYPDLIADHFVGNPDTELRVRVNSRPI